MRAVIVLFLSLACAAPLAAQTARYPSAAEPIVRVRPFVLVSGEEFAADKTFDAVFGARSLRPFWGGGVQFRLHRGLFVEAAVSRFRATGQRVFVDNGQAFSLGIPLTSTVTPIEVTGGYRYRLSRVITPYVAVGVGRYFYSETASFNDTSEDLAVSHAGFVAAAGAEFRVDRWVAVAADAQYTRVPGILGDTGISQAFGEKDLGGTAVRVKILVGP